MKNSRRSTLIDTPVSPPTKGMVFVHTARPESPLIVSKLDERDQVWRVDGAGDLAVWGDLEEWFDELRRGFIAVVYVPAFLG